MQELYCSFTVDAHARKQDIVTFYDELSVLEVIQWLLADMVSNSFEWAVVVV